MLRTRASCSRKPPTADTSRDASHRGPDDRRVLTGDGDRDLSVILKTLTEDTLLPPAPKPDCGDPMLKLDS